MGSGVSLRWGNRRAVGAWTEKIFLPGATKIFCRAGHDPAPGDWIRHGDGKRIPAGAGVDCNGYYAVEPLTGVT